MASRLAIRPATGRDARAMRQLAVDTGVLSVNSTYYYALMAKIFGATAMVAEADGALCGYVTAFPPPGREDTVFVWQVGVAAERRGQGVGKELLAALIRARAPRFVEATIAPSNKASINLFTAVARLCGAGHQFQGPFFTEEELGAGEEAEHLFRIGPLAAGPTTCQEEPTNAHL